MGDFLTFIFITILVIWVLGQLGRIFVRRWLAKKQREFAQQFGGPQPGGQPRNQSRRQSKKEGEVVVQQTAHLEKKVSKSVGDYVEFEEVEITEQTEQSEK